MTETFDGIPDIPKSSWLWRAFEYVRTRSQLPDNIIFWTLVSYCGASLQDCIYINWATKRIFPNLPILIVGESGIGKTGAKSAIKPLFDRCLPFESAEDSTSEAFTKDLAMRGGTRFGNTAGVWVIPELADVIGTKDYQQGSVARLTRMLDNPLNYRISRATQPMPLEIRGYCVLSWLAGTTFEWLDRHVDEAISAGGFLPRVITLYNKQKIKFVPNPVRDDAIIGPLNAELIQVLNAIGMQQQIVTLGDFWVGIQREIYDERINLNGSNRSPFLARRSENILRISLILSVFASETPTAPVAARLPHNCRIASECAKWLEEQAVKLDSDLSAALPHNLEAGAVEKVRQYLFDKRELSYRLLMKNLHLPSKLLNTALRELVLLEEIEYDATKRIAKWRDAAK